MSIPPRKSEKIIQLFEKIFINSYPSIMQSKGVIKAVIMGDLTQSSVDYLINQSVRRLKDPVMRKFYESCEYSYYQHLNPNGDKNKTEFSVLIQNVSLLHPQKFLN
jgi:hypothetical protein